MNTDKVKERIAQIEYYKYCKQMGWSEDKWEYEPESVHDKYIKEADQILADPDILVKHPDQSLPEFLVIINPCVKCESVERLTRYNILKAGFIKVEEK